MNVFVNQRLLLKVGRRHICKGFYWFKPVGNAGDIQRRTVSYQGGEMARMQVGTQGFQGGALHFGIIAQKYRNQCVAYKGCRTGRATACGMAGGVQSS